MKYFIVILTVILICLTAFSLGGVPLTRYVDLMQTTTETTIGLYNSSDRVIILTHDNIKESIDGKNYAVCLEFYNSFCGHCKRFAPIYKQLAEDLWKWRNVIKIMAIDCANDKNNDDCRNYEVMQYPTIRYMSPNHVGSSNLGQPIETQNIDEIKLILMNNLVNETKVDEKWPNLSYLIKSNKNFFDGLSDNIKLGIVIYEPVNSTLGIRLILDNHEIKELSIRRTILPQVATSYNIQNFKSFAIINRNNKIETKILTDVNVTTFQKAIDNVLKQNNIEKPIDNNPLQPNSTEKPIIVKPDEDILKELQKYPKHTVFQADLEQSIRFAIFQEIPRYAKINEERLLALQRFIGVLTRYNPLSANGKKFLKSLQDFIMEHNQQIRGEDIEKKLSALELENSPVFSSSKWIGCTPSKPGLRGFTCGLWQLFHYLLVQAAANKDARDPLEVLQAIHGYVKYFFGCSDCSSHFQQMATKNQIWSMSTKDKAILWLWKAHNEVNSRLSGDETEDPTFPKIQFPLRESCKECYFEMPEVSPKTNTDIKWDSVAVLKFLKKIHDPENLNRFGATDSPKALPQLQLNRNSGNVFTVIDMRMGILLYGFCIAMMLFAVKLFLTRGYRRKTYSHDSLGKV